MALNKIFTGMENGPEAIDGNFTQLQKFDDSFRQVTLSFGLSDVPDAVTKSNLSDAAFYFYRIGKMCFFNARINVVTGNRNSLKVVKVPKGFSASSKFKGDAWNIALSTAKATSPEEYQSRAMWNGESDGVIDVVCTTAGNHYITGSWVTEDDFPS